MQTVAQALAGVICEREKRRLVRLPLLSHIPRDACCTFVIMQKSWQSGSFRRMTVGPHSVWLPIDHADNKVDDQPCKFSAKSPINALSSVV